MERDIREHLWVTVDFAEPATNTLKETAATVESLLRRATQVREGFELLPRDEPAGPAKPDSGASAPAPQTKTAPTKQPAPRK